MRTIVLSRKHNPTDQIGFIRDKKGVCGFQNHGRWTRVAKESIGYLSRKKIESNWNLHMYLWIWLVLKKKKCYNRYYILFSTQKSRFFSKLMSNFIWPKIFPVCLFYIKFYKRPLSLKPIEIYNVIFSIIFPILNPFFLPSQITW